jgi:aryl-alcohol dehydrogenase-like predicted oxidoreductase
MMNSPHLTRVRLGSSGLHTGRIGFGAMPLSGVYGEADDGESIELLRHVIASSVNMIDTSNSYGNGENEKLIGRGIAGLRDQVLLATKFGMQGPGLGRPGEVRRACEESMARLRVDKIDLYYLHRVDPTTPIEVTIEAMAELVEEGLIGAIGLSEVSPATLRAAHAVHPIAAVQQEYSLFTRDVERSLLPTMRELDVALVAYSPFGRGMLTGSLKNAADLPADDARRKRYPRFEGENLDRNLAAANVLFALARDMGTEPSALALGWLLAQGNDVVPIPGTRRRSNFDANVAAAGVEQDPLVTSKLSELFPLGLASGDRYAGPMMEKLDT